MFPATRGKISNGFNLLKTFSYNHPDINLAPQMEGMQSALATIEAAADINTLMGIEGNAARVYFGGFGKMILGKFTFEGRKRRPAPDPVNALLSFGYTLFFNQILSLFYLLCFRGFYLFRLLAPTGIRYHDLFDFGNHELGVPVLRHAGEVCHRRNGVKFPAAYDLYPACRYAFIKYELLHALSATLTKFLVVLFRSSNVAIPRDENTRLGVLLQ